MRLDPRLSLADLETGVGMVVGKAVVAPAIDSNAATARPMATAWHIL